MKFWVAGAGAVAIALCATPLTAWGQPSGTATDLTQGEDAIEATNPFFDNYEQRWRENFERLNRRYQQLQNAADGSFLDFEGLDELIDVIDVRSTSEPNSRSRQSVGVELTEF